MTGLTIRRILATDLPVLLELYAQPSFNRGRAVSLPEAERLFAKMQSYPDYAIYFAELGGEVVGSFALMIVDNIAHWGTPLALAENVVVREGLQSKGIGGAMMQGCFTLARASGAYKVILSSHLQNERAHAFYDGLGFEKHGYSFRLELTPEGPFASPTRPIGDLSDAATAEESPS